MVATTLAAAPARAAGVAFEVPDGGETIPLAGIAVVTGFFSLVASPSRPRSTGGAPGRPSGSGGRR